MDEECREGIEAGYIQSVMADHEMQVVSIKPEVVSVPRTEHEFVVIKVDDTEKQIHHSATQQHAANGSQVCKRIESPINQTVATDRETAVVTHGVVVHESPPVQFHMNAGWFVILCLAVMITYFVVSLRHEKSEQQLLDSFYGTHVDEIMRNRKYSLPETGNDQLSLTSHGSRTAHDHLLTSRQATMNSEQTNNDRFEVASRDHGLGKRLDFESYPDTPAFGVYLRTKELAEELISSAMSLFPGRLNIHFGLIESPSINAWAFKHNQRYFVALTAGAVTMLTLVLDRMLCNRDCFPNIGDATNERASVPAVPWDVLNPERLFLSGVRPLLPNDRRRQVYSRHLAEQALLFLIGHEIAHIMRGHVDYLDNTYGWVRLKKFRCPQY